MSEERFLELAPLAALGALDGEDLKAFDEILRSSMLCRAELAAFEMVAARLPLALEPVAPPSGLREQVLAAVAPAGYRRAEAPNRSWLFPALATAAALIMGLGYVVVRRDRDVARRETLGARAGLEALSQELTKANVELSTLRQDLARERAVRELVAHPESRLARLAGLAAAPKATARIVWNPGSRRAILFVSGLEAAPAGKAYEVWVIAQAAPVAAGVFQVGPDGSAVFTLPIVDDTARVRTFAVTLEPAAGTTAPTGPMVLAGATGSS
jgi:anti-sigma-K factor RskA